MLYGWADSDLEIDLSRGNIERVATDQKLYEALLGGKGKNIRTLWDRVPPEVDPFSPDNLLIIGAGVLVGTMVPSANRTTITYKSPVTETHSYSNIGGDFGAELKFAGYNTITITGKSPTPVYLWIDDDRVELRDASHLWGKHTRQTQRLIREELENDGVEVMCIGLAGENKVYTSTIEHGNGSSASRGGAGAVMGDKNLKAIAVHGTKDVNVADPARLAELCQPILNRTERVRSQIYDQFGYGRVQGYARGVDYGLNNGPAPPELQQKIDSIGTIAQEFMDTTTDKRVACYNCGQRCLRAYAQPDGEYSFIKCSSWVAALRATRIFDLDFALTFYHQCELYGLDTKSITAQITLAIKLYENSILTKKDTGGMHLKFEDEKSALWLIDKIAHREGIGDALADGVYRAAQRIGRGAEAFARHVKKLDQVQRREGGGESGPGSITTAIADGGGGEKLIGSNSDTFWERTEIHDPQERAAYLESEYYHFPEDFKKYLLDEPERSGANNYEGTLLFISHNEETFALADATGLCYYWVGHHPSPPISSRPLIAELISAVTGVDIDEAEATKIARRIISLVRSYDVRAGIKREDDTMPERFFQKDPKTGKSRLERNQFNKWLDKWYELKGWNSQGIPTQDTLVEVGLDDVRQELEQRGILVAPRVPV